MSMKKCPVCRDQVEVPSWDTCRTGDCEKWYREWKKVSKTATKNDIGKALRSNRHKLNHLKRDIDRLDILHRIYDRLL